MQRPDDDAPARMRSEVELASVLDAIAAGWRVSSQREIARRLGLERGAVSGLVMRARRNGDKRFPRRLKPPPKPKPSLRLKSVGEEAGARRCAPATPVRQTGVSFASLPADGCRYVLSGDLPRDFVWCGARVERPGSPWCPEDAAKIRSGSVGRSFSLRRAGR